MNKTNLPPKLFHRFFRWFCHPKLRDSIEGDLIELYGERVGEIGKRKADWKYAKDVLLLFRPGIIRPTEGYQQLNTYGMYKSYFKIGWRNILKNKGTSFINIVGLSIGIGACLLILNFVLFELSYDTFHHDSNQIYRITGISNNEYGEQSIMSPPPLGSELKKNYNEITHSARLILPWSGQAAKSTLGFFGAEESSMKQNFKWGFYTDPDFFTIFDFPMILGDADQALNRPNTIVLSQSTAEKLYGKKWKSLDILGQSLEYVNEFDRFFLEITGVISDSPENSHFQYDFLASYSTLDKGFGKDYAETWGGNQAYTYLKTSPDSKIYEIENMIQQYVLKHAPEEVRNKAEFGLQPLLDIHLQSNLENELKVNGELSRVYFLSILSLLILLVAIANYINLSIAKSISRSSEVGIRKIMGAMRSQLIRQFLAESFILVLFSFVFAIVILIISSPVYFQFTGHRIDLFSPIFLALIFTSIPIIAILSGMYPALVLSGFAPLRLVKVKSLKVFGFFELRKSLVVAQFIVAIVIMAFTMLVFLQVEYMKDSDPGFKKEGVLVVNGPTSRMETWIEHDQKPKPERAEIDVFKSKVMQLGGVEEVSLSWSVPGGAKLMSRIDLGENYQNVSLYALVTDNDYAEVFGIEVLAGTFSTDYGVVINESALSVLNIESPQKAIGINFRDSRNREYRINGVVRDYHHFGFKEKLSAMVFAKNDPSYKLDSFYSLKVNEGDLDNTLTQIQNEYKSVFPSDSFEYYFLDSQFENQYKSEISFSKIFSGFALISIFIGCLGLFGLSMHSVLERSKEIGIRKVLGADIKNILGLFSLDFLKSMLVAILISAPISLFAMDNWLDGFAYRTAISWWIFPLAGFSILVIGLLTVCSQAIKAALANPVNILKSE